MATVAPDPPVADRILSQFDLCGLGVIYEPFLLMFIIEEIKLSRYSQCDG